MSYTREDFARVQAEPCRCVQCGECNGTGNVRYNFQRDETELCERCGGRGIIETCGRCELLSDMDHEEG